MSRITVYPRTTTNDVLQDRDVITIRHRPSTAGDAMRAILDTSDRLVRYGPDSVDVSDGVKDAVKALEREGQVSDEQLDRRAVI